MIAQLISAEELNTKLGLTLINSLEFIKGEVDCINGEPHRAGKTRSYDFGFARRAQLEANADNFTEMNYAEI